MSVCSSFLYSCSVQSSRRRRLATRVLLCAAASGWLALPLTSLGHCSIAERRDGKLPPVQFPRKGSELVALQSAQIADLSACRCP